MICYVCLSVLLLGCHLPITGYEFLKVKKKFFLLYIPHQSVAFIWSDQAGQQDQCSWVTGQAANLSQSPAAAAAVTMVTVSKMSSFLVVELCVRSVEQSSSASVWASYHLSFDNTNLLHLIASFSVNFYHWLTKQFSNNLFGRRVTWPAVVMITTLS